MAAIKIRSLEEVVEAYCLSLGYGGENLERVVGVIHKNFAEKIDSADVIASLDNILVERLNGYFAESRLEDFQKAAMFKAMFLLEGGAEKWGSLLFEKEDLPPEFCRLLGQYRFEAVPDTKMSCMPAQKVDMPSFSNIFHKFFAFFRKG